MAGNFPPDPEKNKKIKDKNLIEAEPPGQLIHGPRTHDKASPGSFPWPPWDSLTQGGRRKPPVRPATMQVSLVPLLPAQQGVDGTSRCVGDHASTPVKVPLCHSGDGLCHGGNP